MSFKDFDICLERYDGEDARVVIPTGVTKIGEGAFSYNETLRSIVIPEGVRQLEGFSFEDCTALEEVTLPASLEEWSWYAFDGCEALRLFHVPAGSWVRQIPDILGVAAVDMDGKPLPPVAVDESEWLYEIHGSEVTLTGRKTGSAGTLYPVEGSVTTLYIPAMLDGKSVTAIGENAFANELEIDALYLPDGLQRIEKGAFAECALIELIRIPESLSYIAPGAFYDCALPEETEERLQAIRGYDPDAEPEEEDEDDGNVIHVSFGGKASERPSLNVRLSRFLEELLSAEHDEDDEDEEDECSAQFRLLYRDELEALGMTSQERLELCKLLRAGEKIKAIVYLRPYAPTSDSPLAWTKAKVEEIMEKLGL